MALLVRLFREQGLTVRLNELRDFYVTFVVHSGLIKEVEIVQGRVRQSRITLS